MERNKLITASIAFFVLSITLSLIIFPEVTFQSSIKGLHTWWEVVFPALLPFFIMAELLIGFGIVQFIGVIFQPIMRPVFNVPGVGSFAWIIGMASGYPAGAKITAQLRENNEITKIEAERLISFTNAASPLFIFGAIAVGFFHHASLGILIAICHYLGNLIVGITMRFYRQNKKNPARFAESQQKNILSRAFYKMHETRITNTRPFGQIIGDAVISSVQILLMIGGFIIFFSVFTTILHELTIFEILHTLLRPILHLLQLPSEIIQPLSTGLFEISIGTEMIAALHNIPIIMQLAVISFLLGFNGISIQAQVASIIANTDIQFHPYFFARLLHATTAAALTVSLFPFFFPINIKHKDLETVVALKDTAYPWFDFFVFYGPIFTIGSIFVALCILLFRLYSSR